MFEAATMQTMPKSKLGPAGCLDLDEAGRRVRGGRHRCVSYCSSGLLPPGAMLVQQLHAGVDRARRRASARRADRRARPPRRPWLRAPSAGRPRNPAASRSCARRLFRRPPCAGRSRSAARCRAAATDSASVMTSRTRRRRVRLAHHLLERAARERADRVEGDVAEQLHPDLVPEARRDRAAEAGGDQRLGDPPGRARIWCRRARRS